MMWREHLRTLVNSNGFQRFIVAVIVLNAITLGPETSGETAAQFGGLLHAVDRADAVATAAILDEVRALRLELAELRRNTIP
jgi:hypothetical protein